jgi:hypothetical protein
MGFWFIYRRCQYLDHTAFNFCVIDNDKFEMILKGTVMTLWKYYPRISPEVLTRITKHLGVAARISEYKCRRLPLHQPPQYQGGNI